MVKKLYNNITHFKDTALKNQDIPIGFILKEDYRVEIIDADTEMDLQQLQSFVGGYIEIVSYINDEQYDVVVDEEGIIKEKKFNMLAYIITGYELYGDVLVLKKGILK